jgi:hypothetical protein
MKDWSLVGHISFLVYADDAGRKEGRKEANILKNREAIVDTK